MYEIASQLRAAQLYAHIGHNEVSGDDFFADHEFLGKLYVEYEENYDAVVERMIGTFAYPDLFKINDAANKVLQVQSQENITPVIFFTTLLDFERKLCLAIEKEIKTETFSQGTINLLAQIADESEVRQYKLQQRLGIMTQAKTEETTQ